MLKNTQKIKEFSKRRKQLVAQAIENCKSGLVDSDAEAMWLWENNISLIAELDNGRDTSHLDDYRSHMVTIESQLPGWKGLSLDRHV